MNPDIDLLRTFVVAADELHFARAAEQLHLDPSAVSRQIRSLETKLRLSLFDRTTRQVRLTRAGEALLLSAREVVAAADRFRAAARSEERTVRGEVRVGIMTHAVGPEVVETVHAVALELAITKVVFVEAEFTDTTAGLRDGMTDVAILFTPFSADGLDLVPLFDLPRLVVVRNSHPLAARSSLRLADIADTPWIVPETDDRVFFDFWMALEQRAETGAGQLVVGGSCRTAEEGLLAAMSGAGIAIGATARADFRPSGLTLVPVVDLPPCGVAVALPSATGDTPARRFARALQARVAAPVV